MSYSGYSQLFCENGHLSIVDCWFADSTEECDICKAPIVFENMVDTTNGSNVGYVDFSKFLIKDAEYKTCDMGHCHKISEAVYRIPTQEEITRL